MKDKKQQIYKDIFAVKQGNKYHVSIKQADYIYNIIDKETRKEAIKRSHRIHKQVEFSFWKMKIEAINKPIFIKATSHYKRLPEVKPSGSKPSFVKPVKRVIDIKALSSCEAKYFKKLELQGKIKHLQKVKENLRIEAKLQDIISLINDKQINIDKLMVQTTKDGIYPYDIKLVPIPLNKIKLVPSYKFKDIG